MHTSRLIDNLIVIALLIGAYYLFIFMARRSTLRAQKTRRRKEYDRLIVDIITCNNSDELANLCLETREFIRRFYDEDPKDVSMYSRLLERMITKKLAEFESDLK